MPAERQKRQKLRDPDRRGLVRRVRQSWRQHAGVPGESRRQKTRRRQLHPERNRWDHQQHHVQSDESEKSQKSERQKNPPLTASSRRPSGAGTGPPAGRYGSTVIEAISVPACSSSASKMPSMFAGTANVAGWPGPTSLATS